MRLFFYISGGYGEGLNLTNSWEKRCKNRTQFLMEVLFFFFVNLLLKLNIVWLIQHEIVVRTKKWLIYVALF